MKSAMSRLLHFCGHVLLSMSFGLALRIIPPERLLKERLFKPGDYMIGGLFPAHVGVTEDRKHCTGISKKGLSWIQAFLFAMETINNDPEILPNITLGYDVRDDCNQVARAVEAAYDFVSGRKFLGNQSTEACRLNTKVSSSQQTTGEKRNQNCRSVKSSRRPSVVAVVGSASSVISETVANIFGVDYIPQISYAASSRWLSDKKRYRSFFRTIPSDDRQVKVIVELVNYFNWTYLSTLATNSVYGELDVEAFEEEIKEQKICQAIRHVVPTGHAEQALKRFADLMVTSKGGKKSSVVLGFLPEHEAPSLLKEIGKHQLKGKTFIASESWADTVTTLEQPPEVAQGMLGIVSSRGKVRGYENYLSQVPLQKLTTENPWLKGYLEKTMNCSFEQKNEEPACPERIEQNRMSVFNSTLFFNRKVSHVVDAVYAIAYSLHNLICREGVCGKGEIKHQDLVKKLFNVKFHGSQGRMSFDHNGDPRLAKYVITNVQQRGDNLEYVDVGHWDGSLTIFDSKIVWADGSRVVPVSVCSEDCTPGFRIVYGTTKCCWTCVICDEGTFTNSTNKEACYSCKDVYEKGWTNNANRTDCVELPLEYLRRTDPVAIALSVISLLLFLADMFCLGVFVKYRDTPVVKGSNRELTFLLLAVLGLGFLSPFLYIGQPMPVICKIQPNAFGFIFTVCISVMFTKTRRILMVFTARMSSATAIHYERRRAEQKQVLLLITMTLVEGSMVGIATYLLPPAVTSDYSKPGRVIVHCGDNWLTIHLIAMGYTCFIAIICTFLAFKARKLPETFNEARSISFTMFMMILVLIGSIPACLGSQGKTRTSWFCLSAMLAALPKLVFLIVPKVRIILFYPEKNRADVVRSQTTNHILTRAVRRTSSVSLANSGSHSAQLRRRSNTASSTDSSVVMIHSRKHAKMNRQVSFTESQMDGRRFSDLSEHSGVSGYSEQPTVVETDTDVADQSSAGTDSHRASETKL